MGHATDKIELIILGGTWSDYPEEYQRWFVAELFRALNDAGGGSRGSGNAGGGGCGGGDGRGGDVQGGNAGGGCGGEDGGGGSGNGNDRDDAEQNARARRDFYKSKGLSNRAEELSEFVREQQQKVDDGTLTYNQAIEQIYGSSDLWQSIAAGQVATLDELTRQHRINRTARHRVVGLVVETRPDTITIGSLTLLRRLGCTKVQMGIQSLHPALLHINNRTVSPGRIRESFELLRLFGFKIHVHFMANLYGASLEEDRRDYPRLVTDGAYLPDEVKLYPCSLVAGTGLVEHYRAGEWQPYSEDELVGLLMADVLATPGFVRVSRMVRDISAQDIMAGNRKANLRQMVESRIEALGERIAEMRYREISTSETDLERLTLETITYETTVSDEYFLQWVTPENKLVGFLRLSLPSVDYLRRRSAVVPVGLHEEVVPVGPHEAMIREVHVYGKVAPLRRTGEGGQPGANGESRDERARGAGEGDVEKGVQSSGASEGAQHLGLGRQLIEAACEIARTHDYQKINVISAVGTREYYQSLGFEDGELYQQMSLL
jgi:elongator complex protein 3